MVLQHTFCSKNVCRCGNGAASMAKWKASLLPPGLAAVCWCPSVILLLACICSEQVPDPLQLQHSQRRYGWDALGCTLGPLSFFPGVPICVPAHLLPHGTCPSTDLVHSSSCDVHACLPPHTLPVVEPQ